MFAHRPQRPTLRSSTVLAALAAAAIAWAAPFGPGATTSAWAQTVDNAALNRLQVRLSALENDVRAATGPVEELEFRIRRMEQRLETALSDLELRLNQLEAAAAAGNGRTAPSPSAAAPPNREDMLPVPPAPQPPATARTVPAPPPPTETAVRLPDGSVEQQYAYAYRLLQSAQYDQAESALQSFVTRNPDAALADNARYWLAETFYVRSDFEQAAKAFATAYQTNTSGPKAPDSLLKLGMSLARLDRTEDACTTFAELKRAFPQAGSRITSRRDSELTRLGCP